MNQVLRRERIEWLRALIAAYKDEHDWDTDEDATATYEMLRECRDLAEDLDRELEPEIEAARPEGLAAEDQREISF